MIRILLLLLLIATPAIAADLQSLEKTVTERAKRDPATAEEYFIRQIEKRPSPSSEEQAVYVLGMGIAAEQQNNIVDAYHYYRGAEVLGNTTASASAQRLQKVIERVIGPSKE